MRGRNNPPVNMPVKSTNNIKEIEKAIGFSARKALLIVAEQFSSDVKENTPVQTGRLKSSIRPTGTIEESGDKIQTSVFTDVTYAPFVEFGTVKMTPRAYFRRTADQEAGKLERLFGKLIQV